MIVRSLDYIMLFIYFSKSIYPSTKRHLFFKLKISNKNIIFKKKPYSRSHFDNMLINTYTHNLHCLGLFMIQAMPKLICLFR